jgi:hypothetical protein
MTPFRSARVLLFVLCGCGGNPAVQRTSGSGLAPDGGASSLSPAKKYRVRLDFDSDIHRLGGYVSGYPWFYWDHLQDYTYQFTSDENDSVTISSFPATINVESLGEGWLMFSFDPDPNTDTWGVSHTLDGKAGEPFKWGAFEAASKYEDGRSRIGVSVVRQ